MASETDDLTFEDIDFEEETAGNTSVLLSKRVIGLAISNLLIVAGFLYDWQVVPKGEPTFQEADLGIYQFRGWDVTSVDWMFMWTLVTLFFVVVPPIYRNPQMARFYLRNFRRHRLGFYSSFVVLGIALIGFFGPLILSPPEFSFTAAYQPPVGITAKPQGEPVTGTWKYPLGTDSQGRSMLKLVVYGARVSLEIALISTLIATTIGGIVGATGAFVGGIVDEVLFRYVDLQAVFPVFIFFLFIASLFGAQLWFIIALFGFFSWEGTARLVRAEALQRTEEAYIQSARASGGGTTWIIFRHVLPNVSVTLITIATLSVPGFVLGEAALAFLGFSESGIYSWGTTIAAGRNSLSNAPWISTIPGFFLFFFVLCINAAGDAVADAIDPRNANQ
ncbi:MAG: ABC transporter permease [Halobaculum sp.]